jgi:hypothetical protein
VVGELDRRVGLSGDLDDPALAPPPQARRPAPPGQLGEQRLGPEVLVNIDLQACERFQ